MRGKAPPRSIVLLALLAAAAACGGPRPPDVAMSGEAPQDAGLRPLGDGKKQPDRPPEVGADPLRCGCALCEPVVSDDPCIQDSDCGPSAPCHADRCVGIAKAKPRQPSDMCTLQLMCKTIDANACGCVNGRCALYPRKR
jgi:hypothetical protein